MIKLTRLSDWRSRMHAHNATLIREPFVWGQNDCARAADAHIFAVCGQMVGADLCDYDTAFGAQKCLLAGGYNNLLEMCQDRLPTVKPSFAQVADLALLRVSESITEDGVGWIIGIYLGERIGLVSPEGYATAPRSDPRIQYAFKVG